jgi:hypothetical protein
MGEQGTEQEIIAEADKRGEQDIILEEFIDLIQDNAIFSIPCWIDRMDSDRQDLKTCNGGLNLL